MLTDAPVLTTERLTLRLPRAEDWPYWRDFAASDRARFIGGPMDEGRAWRAFGHVIGHWTLRGYGSFIFNRTGGDRPLGMAGPWYPADWPEPELGWTIWWADIEGQGFAQESMEAARTYAYDVLGWTTAVSYIAPGNTRSIALARRLGCRPDPGAPRPEPSTLVFRHPAPEDLPPKEVQ